MNCPKHPETELQKVRLDRYYCSSCRTDWLIHKFNNTEWSFDQPI